MFKKKNTAYLVCLYLFISCASSLARAASDDVHVAFLNNAFRGSVPELKTLWLNADLKQVLVSDFDYMLNRVRIRYWQDSNRSAWILDEVGKEQPITMGIVVEHQRIVSIEVLAYRESRGEEIRYPFFRDQFSDLELVEKRGQKRLSHKVDGITGATLSVRAMKKVAKVALYLHQVTLNE